MSLPSQSNGGRDPQNEAIYRAIAESLRDFGYSDVSANMIHEVHEAMGEDVTELPHGVVGMFARRQLVEAEEEGRLG